MCIYMYAVVFDIYIYIYTHIYMIVPNLSLHVPGFQDVCQGLGFPMSGYSVGEDTPGNKMKYG